MSSSFTWTDEPGAATLAPGATVLTSFPSAGLAATVAALYIVRTLKLPRIGTLESPDAPPVAVIQSGEVQPPVRVYGRADLAVVLSEFPPTLGATAALSRAILDGAEARKARTLLCLEGVVPHPTGDEDGEASGETVWAATSRRDDASGRIVEAGRLRRLEDGVIGGVSGAILVGGLHRPLPIAALLVSARDTAGFPDHRAGAAMIEALDRILPELKIDTGPLRSQAEMIERALRAALSRQGATESKVEADPNQQTMYQ